MTTTAADTHRRPKVVQGTGAGTCDTTGTDCLSASALTAHRRRRREAWSPRPKARGAPRRPPPHPCRRPGRGAAGKSWRPHQPRLDAEVLIGGRLGPGESIVMRMYGRLGLHAESVVLPLLAPDAPSSPGGTARHRTRSRTTRSACWPTVGSPTRATERGSAGAAANPGRGLRARRHRPGLDPHHRVAGLLAAAFDNVEESPDWWHG